MDIDYKLSDTDKKVVKTYLIRKCTRRIVRNNAFKDGYFFNLQKSKKASCIKFTF